MEDPDSYGVEQYEYGQHVSKDEKENKKAGKDQNGPRAQVVHFGGAESDEDNCGYVAETAHVNKEQKLQSL